MLDRSIAPPIIPISEVLIPEANSYQLANGVLCHYISAGTQPVVKLEVVFPAGSVNATLPTLAAFTAGMLTEGTLSKTSAQISQLVAFYGAELECSASADRATLTLFALKKHLPTLLPLIKELVTEASFPQEEIDSQLRIRIRNLEVQQQKTSYLASSAIGNVLYGSAHPYGRIVTASSFEAVTRNDMQEFYQNYYLNKSESLVVIASGLIDSEVRTWIDEYLGSIQLGNHSLLSPTYKEEPAAEKQHIIAKEGSQSTIRLATKVISQSHPDIYQLVFLKEALGGYFGSRLMKNIREDKGYTYGIYAQIIHGNLGSRLQIGADVGMDVTQAALNEIYFEMQKLIDEPIPAEEMELIRGSMMGSLAGAVTNALSLADCFKTVYFGGVDYSYFTELTHTIQSVSSLEIQAMAAKYLQKDNFYEVVAGGKA